MAFDRGSPGDYNLWAELIEDDAWSWEGLLPYFKKVFYQIMDKGPTLTPTE